MSSPASAASWAPLTLSKIHLILVAEKYGSGVRPVFERMVSLAPWAMSRSTMGAVRRHCQPIAL